MLNLIRISEKDRSQRTVRTSVQDQDLAKAEEKAEADTRLEDGLSEHTVEGAEVTKALGAIVTIRKEEADRGSHPIEEEDIPPDPLEKEVPRSIAELRHRGLPEDLPEKEETKVKRKDPHVTIVRKEAI